MLGYRRHPCSEHPHPWQPGTAVTTQITPSVTPNTREKVRRIPQAQSSMERHLQGLKRRNLLIKISRAKWEKNIKKERASSSQLLECEISDTHFYVLLKHFFFILTLSTCRGEKKNTHTHTSQIGALKNLSAVSCLHWNK